MKGGGARARKDDGGDEWAGEGAQWGMRQSRASNERQVPTCMTGREESGGGDWDEQGARWCVQQSRACSAMSDRREHVGREGRKVEEASGTSRGQGGVCSSRGLAKQ